MRSGETWWKEGGRKGGGKLPENSKSNYWSVNFSSWQKEAGKKQKIFVWMSWKDFIGNQESGIRQNRCRFWFPVMETVESHPPHPPIRLREILFLTSSINKLEYFRLIFKVNKSFSFFFFFLQLKCLLFVNVMMLKIGPPASFLFFFLIGNKDHHTRHSTFDTRFDDTKKSYRITKKKVVFHFPLNWMKMMRIQRWIEGCVCNFLSFWRSRNQI